MLTARAILVAGALLAGLSVALGAFGAHGLGERLEDRGFGDEIEKRLGWFETGARYQMYHALAILLLGVLSTRAEASAPAVAVIAFAVGILLFSGSLYALTFAGPEYRWFGAITPLGGLSMLVGWAATALWCWRSF